MGNYLKLVVVLLVILCSGCATITRGKQDVFSIQSTPTGATAKLSNGLTCITPCTLELPRKNGFVVTLELDGYKPVSTNVIPKQAGAGSAGMAGNVLLGGLIGAAVDAGSGAMKDLYPNPLVVTMVPTSSTAESVVEQTEEAYTVVPPTSVEEPTADESLEQTSDLAAAEPADGS